ncbi:MAG: type VI secretion system ImpA family N-terminal domain-containing protein, partial [Planctomycetota bacterium]
MAVIDVDRLLAPVSDDEPSGPDLEYDPAFQAMVAASKGKPEQEFGDNVIPAVDPEWRTVREHAVELLGRTRDIRPLISLAASTTMVDGIQSLGTVLDGLRRLLDQQWETVHPELDREDDNDPTMRFNALLGLCDPEGLPRCVRDATLVELRGIGSFSYRSIQIANGQAPHTGEGEPPSTAMIEGAFLDCDLDELTARAESVDLALTSLVTLESDLQQRVGSSSTPDLSPVRTTLSEVHAVLTEQLNRRGVGAAAAPTAAVEADP